MRWPLTSGLGAGHAPPMAQKKKAAKRSSGPSGQHLHRIRTLSGVSDEEWERWGEAAKEEGTSRVEFVRRAASGRADATLRKK
jgi:hypothetical protein